MVSFIKTLSGQRVRKECCSVRGRGKLSKQYPKLPCGELKISEHIEYQVNFFFLNLICTFSFLSFFFVVNFVIH